VGEPKWKWAAAVDVDWGRAENGKKVGKIGGSTKDRERKRKIYTDTLSV
jgi:hypothetical protein